LHRSCCAVHPRKRPEYSPRIISPYLARQAPRKEAALAACSAWRANQRSLPGLPLGTLPLLCIRKLLVFVDLSQNQINPDALV